MTLIQHSQNFQNESSKSNFRGGPFRVPYSFLKILASIWFHWVVILPVVCLVVWFEMFFAVPRNDKFGVPCRPAAWITEHNDILTQQRDIECNVAGWLDGLLFGCSHLGGKYSFLHPFFPIPDDKESNGYFFAIEFSGLSTIYQYHGPPSNV